MNDRHVIFTLLACVSMIPVESQAATLQPGACTATAQDALAACRNGVADDYWITIGNCQNLRSAGAREECIEDAAAERTEGREECTEQSEARLEACGELGESRYDPRIDPALFVDPREIGKSVAPNPYLMLIPGRTMVYANGDERVRTAVTRRTAKIMGVECAVIHDVAREGGEIIEDTIDWLAQDIYGNVWYFGEISQEFEGGELTSLEGSWKAGVDYAKPGIVMKAAPAAGDVYRQEFSLGNAEDMARVVSLAASASAPAGSCNKNCLLTEDFTPIEPDVLEKKFYAPGVGLLVAVDAETGEREKLIAIEQH